MTPAEMQIFVELLKSWSAQIKSLNFNCDLNDICLITVLYRHASEARTAVHVNSYFCSQLKLLKVGLSLCKPYA
jgi:hypothetical protein